jgi:hypothetical protein
MIPLSPYSLATAALKEFLQTETGIRWDGIGDRVQPGKVLGAINMYQSTGREDNLNEFQSEIVFMTVSVSLAADTHYTARNLAWDWADVIARLMKLVSIQGIVGANNKLLLKGCHLTGEGKVVTSEKFDSTQNSSLAIARADLFYKFPLETDFTSNLNLWPSLG